MAFTIGFQRPVKLAELIFAILDGGFAFLNQKKEQPGGQENKDDAVYFQHGNRSFVYEQSTENSGSAEKNPYSADAGIENDNIERCKSQVKFFHRISAENTFIAIVS